MSTDAVFTRLDYPSLHRDEDTAQARDRARAAGHAAGYATGLRAAEDETRRLRARLQAEHEAAQAQLREEFGLAAAALAQAAERVRSLAVPQARQLQEAAAVAALELAEAVLGRELEASDASAQAALLRALDTAEPELIQSVRMHPRDLELVGAAAEGAGVRLVPDAGLSRGDAVAEFPDGYLDATLGSALARARRALLGDGA